MRSDADADAEPLLPAGVPGWSAVTTKRWLGWGVSALFFCFDVFARLTIDVIRDTLQSEFDLTASTVTTYFGSSFFYAYAAMQIPMGFGLDALGPRKTYFLGNLLR